ncbi:MAG: hypothetical protein ACLFTT_14485 [Candidatus Hydrogenedentota bacterium]
MLLRALPWAALAAALTFMALHSLALQEDRWIPDDTYITLRFADNLAAGHGPVYNPGERVEGYTNFLWMALLAGGHALGGNLENLSQVYGIVFSSATLVLLALTPWIVPGLGFGACAAAILLLGSCGVFTIYATAGMEVPLLHFLITLALVLHFRSRQCPEGLVLPLVAGLMCALAAMTRPDAVLVAGVLGCDRLAHAVRTRTIARLGAFAGAFAVIFGLYFLWRMNYYGHLLPNTFYAKVGGEAAQMTVGLDYVSSFAGATFVTLALAVGASLSGGAFGENRPVRGVLLGLLCLYTVYIVLVGGDFMPGFRFFAPIYPALCLLAGMTLQHRARWAPAAGALLLAAIIYNVLMLPSHRDMRRASAGNVSRKGEIVGQWLAEHAPERALLATNTAGSIPFFSGLRTIDMLGLCDEHIAHRDLTFGRRTPGHGKGDGAYVLSRKPDYIQFGSASGTEKPKFRGDAEIYTHPQFKQNYVLKKYRMPSRGTLRLYVRKPAAGGKGIDAKPYAATPFRTEKDK